MLVWGGGWGGGGGGGRGSLGGDIGISCEHHHRQSSCHGMLGCNPISPSISRSCCYVHTTPAGDTVHTAIN